MVHFLFFEESKQWKDRKEVLDDLLSLLTQNPKPTSDSDYSELIKILKKVIHLNFRMNVFLFFWLNRLSQRIVIFLLFLLLQNVCQHWQKVYEKHLEIMLLV